MKKTIKIVGILMVLLFYSCNQKTKQAYKIIDKLYTYIDEHGRAPTNLSKIGCEFNEEGPIYYEMEPDSINFIIWYSIGGVGESKYYRSDTKKWN